MSKITDSDLNQARDLIYTLAGIYLPQNKNPTIKNRLEKIARDYNIDDFQVFFSELRAGRHKQDFINAFTTNKTDFFREGFHFLDMVDRILPHRLQESSSFRVYCSASSTGEEPYSIAATLLHAKEIYHSSTPVSVVATDIDTSVLDYAQKGEYIVDSLINPLPNWIDLQDFFQMDLSNPREMIMNAKPNLKRILTFKQLNLYHAAYPFAPKEFDIIFCRNVLIYFKTEDQEKILEKLFSHLKVGGTLYLGHSESILSLAPKVERLGQNIFVKKED